MHRFRVAMAVLIRCLVVLAGACSVFAPGCGSGIVGSVLASNKDRRVPPPGVRILQDGPAGFSSTGPLVPDASSLILRTIVIDNYQAPATAEIRVVLRELTFGAEQEQVSPVVRSRSGNSTTISFFYTTAGILNRVKDPTARDIDAELRVDVDGQNVAPPTPFRLLRQPRISLVDSGQVMLSPIGTSQIRLRVHGVDGVPVDDLAGYMLLRVGVVDPRSSAPGNLSIQTINSLTVVVDEQDPTARIVSGTAPALPFPAQAFLVLASAVHGVSTIEDRAFFRPLLGPLVPAAGSADGGTKITLTGSALVSFKTGPAGEVSLDFAATTIRVRKGGREVVVDSNLFDIDRSNENRIVFTMPPSPDGRAGVSEVRLSSRLASGTELQGDPISRFSYGDSTLCFGPRGTCLRDVPIKVDYGSFETRTTPVSDFVSLHSEAGVPSVQLYAAAGNGQFSRLGGRFVGGDLNDASQTDPADMSVADVDADGLDDIIIANRGSGAAARHSFLIGQQFPATQLIRSATTVSDFTNVAAIVRADVDGNERSDFVALSASARAPTLFVANPKTTGPKSPGFTSSALSQVGTSTRFDKILATDINDDAYADLVLAIGYVTIGSPPTVKTGIRVVTLKGSQSGSLTLAQDLTMEVPNRTLTANSRVVGLHMIGATEPLNQHLAIVLSGDAASSQSLPTVAVLRRDDGSFAKSIGSSDVVTTGFASELRHSACGDLDGDGQPELVVAAGTAEPEAMQLLSWSSDRLEVISGGIELGAEIVRRVTGLRIGAAVAPGTFHAESARNALFVTHEDDTDGNSEHRVSTFLGAPGPRLLSADASRQFGSKIESLVAGQFALAPPLTVGASRDVYVATADGLHLIVNDGVGNLVGDIKVDVPGLLANSIVPIDQVVRPGFGPQTVAFLTFDSTRGCRLGLVDPKAVDGKGAGALFNDRDLRSLAPASLRSRAPHPNSKIINGDVDGDGVRDLVVLLVLRDAIEIGREDESVIVLLRGNNAPQAGDIPFDVPSQGLAPLATTHGNASDIVMGNFAPGTALAELAIAIPAGGGAGGGAGNHVRFYRYNTQGAVPRFEPSFQSTANTVMFAGTGPTRLAMADFDGNGTDDVAVATSGDSTLRLMLNLARASDGEANVDVGRFLEATAQPLATPPGTPTDLIAQDLNGDGQIDLVLPVLASGAARSYSVSYYLNPGFVDGVRSAILPPLRTGDAIRTQSGTTKRNALMSMAVADLNGDGRFDMVFGWGSAGPADRNIRVVFGGTR